MKRKRVGGIAVLFLSGAALSLIYVRQSSAFTLVESQFLPAVQLEALESVQVSASNFSSQSVEVVIDIQNAAGKVVSTKTVTIAANNTYALRYNNGNSTGNFSAVVNAGAASSIASSFEVLGTTGEVIAITLPYVESTVPAVQNTAALRLIPGQSAAASVTNISGSPAQFSLTIYNNTGKVVLTEGGTISAAQTLTFPFSNAGTGNNGYRAVVSSAANSVISDVMAFDKTTGQINSILFPPNPCSCSNAR